MKKTTCLLLILWITVNAFAQTTPRRPGEIIVHLDQGVDIQDLIKSFNQREGAGYTLKGTLSDDWHMYLIGFNETEANSNAALERWQRARGVHAAQWNYKVNERSLEPNDTDWWRQGDMVLINAPEVWDASTGGVTPNGDTIVVAVLEKGNLLTHPDLAPNRFWNWHEIPNNGIDDDGNGYVDDFGGWNPQTFGDDLGSKSPHGTGVCGIIGARGNNQMGMTGVNWFVKLMNVSGMEYESEIVQGYEYAGKMRRLYNETHGAKGAFVVSTNASFGFDYERAENHPVWCAVYDSLGKLGIISVGATINQGIDVDVQGDMPTTCPSEYLIAVTNITKAGVKVSSAGYGSTSIDLGAPGTDTYSTSNYTQNGEDVPSYAPIGGCSAAAPHVTGSIALLYSLGCEEFTKDALTDPVACARRVRDAILNNTEPNATLSGITTTGGHLNLSKALAGVRGLCNGAKVGPLDLLDIKVLQNGTRVRIYYQTPNFQPYTFRVFNMLGQQLFEDEWTPQQFSESYIDFDFNTALLPQGVYVYSIGRGNAVKSKKFPKI